jgi:signal transduction histidine kinase
LLEYEEGEIEATYAMFLELLHPEEKDETLEAVRAHLEDHLRYDVEIRLRTKSGEYRWFRSRGQALRDETGRSIRMAGSIQDITDRKHAEEALRASSLRLVEAQETERRHIARELHDEIGQALTGLKLNLETNMRLPPGVIGDSLAEATEVVHDIMGKVRELSLSLRPPMLDDFGLLHALLWHFQRYTSRTNVLVTTLNLTSPNGLDGRRFPSDIETAAYRIVQEALTNIARHAKAPEAIVSLWTDHSTLYVQIQDHGIGFDPESVQASRPCTGLAGIRERVALLNGCFTLESVPGVGTQLTAELPLDISFDGGTQSGQDDNTVSG